MQQVASKRITWNGFSVAQRHGCFNVVEMENEGTDIKKLISEAKQHLKLEINYGKLTAVEKISILLSGIALVAALTVIGCFAIYYITSTLVLLFAKMTGVIWAAYLVMSLILVLLMGIVFAMRKQWIIDPITRFVTKLFLNPNDNE